MLMTNGIRYMYAVCVIVESLLNLGPSVHVYPN